MTHPPYHIKEMKLEVCSACQNDCAECAHGELRLQTKQYQLSQEQLYNFIKFTEESNYFIEHLAVHGGGDPLLWKHFNEALPLLGRSPSIGTIVVTTNGLGIKRIDEKAWEYIDSLNISFYDAQPNSLFDEQVIAKYGHKIKVEHMTTFYERLKNKDETFSTPCDCMCTGPMLLGDDVFLYCGPPVFDAAELQGKDIWELKDLRVKIGPDYLSKINPTSKGNMDICSQCWANSNYLDENRLVKQSITGGGWQ